MKAYVLASTLLVVAAAPSAASVSVVGGSYARACYDSAKSRMATPDAVTSCDLALAIQGLNDRDRVATHVNRGILHMLRGAGELAKADYDRALAMDPKEPEAWLNKGVLVFDQGDYPTAREFAERAMELGTTKPAVALFIRAVAKADAGEAKSAYQDLLRAAELAPNWSEPQRELKRYHVIR